MARQLKKSLSSFFLKNLEVLLAIVLISVLLRSFVFTSFVATQKNMEPTILSGDILVVNKLSKGLSVPFYQGRWWFEKELSSGDLIAFSCRENSSSVCVRRIVAINGDRVEINRGKLIINGNEHAYEKKGDSIYTESYRGNQRDVKLETVEGIAEEPVETESLVVPLGKVLILPDNRSSFSYSKEKNLIEPSRILGKVDYIWLSYDWGKEGSGIRWKRVFSAIK